jgi:antitoxin MazE5
MARQRVSTTVDSELLGRARRLHAAPNDASLLDAALTALIAAHRAAEIDAAYRAYDEHPLDEADEWGDLESFRAAAGSS